MVQMLCYLLECLLTPENTPPDCAKELYELYFVFAAVWAFGGALFQDQVSCGPDQVWVDELSTTAKTRICWCLTTKVRAEPHLEAGEMGGAWMFLGFAHVGAFIQQLSVAVKHYQKVLSS